MTKNISKITNFSSKIKIAVDGHSSSGKGTICKIISQKYHLFYSESSYFYRALAYLIYDQSIKIANIEYILELSQNYDLLFNIDKSKIYSPQVTQIASKIAAISQIRESLLIPLRKIVDDHDRMIMDGRDVGSKIMPDADYKFFLTADLKTRSLRRYLQYREQNIEIELEDVEKQIKERDIRDQTREVSPLEPQKDSIIIDSSNLNIDQLTHMIEKFLLK